MGKGDQRSRRGKIHRGTFGRRRPKPKTHKPLSAADAAAKAAPSAKDKKEPRIVKKQPKE